VAQTLSAKKRIRQNAKRRARNRWRKDRIKNAIREFDEALEAGKTDVAAEKLQAAYKQLDQVAAKGTIHKNAASRQKSRLAKKLNQAGQ